MNVPRVFRTYTVARKLALVGLVLMFGRGSVLQLASALFVAVAFAMAQGMVKPFKMPLDNQLRLSTELHTVITILIASTIKADPEAESNQSTYDVVMVFTFLLLVALPFAAVVALKVKSVFYALEPKAVSAARDKLTAANTELEELKKNHQTPGNQEQDEHDKEKHEETVDKKTPEEIKVKENEVDKLKKELETAQKAATGVQMAIRRFQLGLQDSKDRDTMIEYFGQPKTGEKLWSEKVIASHLTADEMRSTFAKLEARLPKSHALGYHFTDLDSVNLILGKDSIGLRASTVGQLGGGVSINLTSPVDLGWAEYGTGDDVKFGEKSSDKATDRSEAETSAEAAVPAPSEGNIEALEKEKAEPAEAEDYEEAPKLKKQALKDELEAMKLRALQKRAEELGVDEDKLDDAEEKSEVIALILAALAPITKSSTKGSFT